MNRVCVGPVIRLADPQGILISADGLPSEVVTYFKSVSNFDLEMQAVIRHAFDHAFPDSGAGGPISGFIGIAKSGGRYANAGVAEFPFWDSFALTDLISRKFSGIAATVGGFGVSHQETDNAVKFKVILISRLILTSFQTHQTDGLRERTGVGP